MEETVGACCKATKKVPAMHPHTQPYTNSSAAQARKVHERRFTVAG